MIESILYNVGIYCRLSLDDGSVGESGSIQTQKMMLEKYCRDNHYTIKEVYIDDGYSGLNFDRPAFKQLLLDIEAGKINMVITKDLSKQDSSGATQDTTTQNGGVGFRQIVLSI